MKITHPSVVLLILGLGLAGCNKIKEKLLEDPLADYKPCNIKSIEFLSSPQSVATFYYNKHGNPDSVKLTQTNTGNPNVKFRYDSHQRITDYISYFNGSNLGFLRWSHYYYPNDYTTRSSSFITFNNGALTNAALPTVYAGFYTDDFDYDAEGRVINFYTYDANDNIANATYNYDDKVNPHRTNKIWMFVDQNYSRNNPLDALTYNQYAFPTRFGIDSKMFGNTFLDRSIMNTKISYMCD